MTTPTTAEEPWTILKVLRWTQGRFTERGLRTPRLDAEVLLTHVTGKDRVGLYTHFDQPLAKEELARYRELIRRRLAGEPVAYLVNKQEFWSLSLHVDARVLVPRADTETLVEHALAWLKGRPAPRVADVGTGSGAIAIALAHERPDAELFAVDRSPGALEVARKNAASCDVDVTFLEGDLLSLLSKHAPFDAIVSNPPYIPDGEFEGLQREVKQEPREALLGGKDGLDLIRRLIAGAPALLGKGGLLAIEVGDKQAPVVAQLLERAGFVAVATRKDMAGIERVVSGERAG
mgnify:CR=1 FL=1